MARMHVRERERESDRERCLGGQGVRIAMRIYRDGEGRESRCSCNNSNSNKKHGWKCLRLGCLHVKKVKREESS
jgi:hypothetical protein